MIMKKIQVITLFPEMFEKVFNSSMMWKAQEAGAVEFGVVDLRDFGIGPRKQVDDTLYGGGDGMLLMVEPLVSAIEFAQKQNEDWRLGLGKKSRKARVILPTPRGKTYKQSDAKRLAADDEDLIIICPRYEGYDERITEWVDEQISVGNYVLTGGEIPAMLIADSVVRLLPGVLGGENSAELESFQENDEYIEHPHYTRPENFQGMKVPEVLLSGHHKNIEKWKQRNSNK